MKSTAARFDFDLAIIGGGSAGYAAARTAANEGLKVVVIEGGEEVGGLCILRGCMPTKALLYASEVLHLSRHAGLWGVHNKQTSYDYEEVMARKDRLIQDSGRKLSAKNVIISTGSVVAPPPLPRLREVGYLTSDEALRLRKLPRS